mgnify:CR=1 FL=1
MLWWVQHLRSFVPASRAADLHATAEDVPVRSRPIPYLLEAEIGVR